MVRLGFVEQNIRHALEVANRAYVMENGHIVSKGEARGFCRTVILEKRIWVCKWG